MKTFATDLLEATLVDKFDAALCSVELENGTSLATVLASAIMVDLRCSGSEDAVDIIDTLDDDAIKELGALLLFAIEGDDRPFTLPLGTVVRPYEPGSVEIGEEVWVIQTGKPGLSPMEIVRHDAYGRNLELLREFISKWVQGRPWQCIGLPSPSNISDYGPVNLLAFPPFHDAGGVVLQREVNSTGAACFAAAMPEDIKFLALSIANDMRAMWHRRQDIADQARAVRQIAESKISNDAVGVALHAIAIDLHRQHTDKHFGFYVHYDAIDDAFRPGVVRNFMPAPFEGVYPNQGATHEIVGRREARDAVRALGADGEIDSFAAAVVRYAPEGQAEVLARLAIDYDTVVQFVTPLGPVYATLYWRDGCIEAEISAPGRIVKRGEFLEWYEEDFDADDAQTLLGLTPLDVMPLPFDARCTIKQATPLRPGVKMQLDSNSFLVNCASGRIWER
ncbi:hypothetical protein NZL82_19330 [Sphingomonas sanguinis]|uniref:hypothetical protein n=1 Tax=Sphingomonas sp. LC-1 TaxID=3110957 RepID=UPI0021BB0D8E|nr:hypothetical protein [Sphingomonas sp. LC-1]MCT8004021.1 hypothetical protein [Sphingomonas sp. LC-1]